MSTYRVSFYTKISLRVEIDAEDEDAAADLAWEAAEDYLRTINGDPAHGVTADATLDGIGADDIEATA